jgi:TonB family protein
MLRQNIAKRWQGRKYQLFLGLSLLLGLVLSPVPVTSQTNEQASDRKVLTRVEPDYPETLKRLYIGGVVRVEAVVLPSGTVESTQLIGGNPILGQSAMKAIKQWKYVQGNTREKLLVRMEFDPHR